MNDKNNKNKTKPKSSLVLGTFNSEKIWEPKNYLSLPSFNDIQANKIIHTMDELLFPFCNSQQDILITNFPFNSSLSDYLKEIGFEFSSFSLYDNYTDLCGISGQLQSIIKQLYSERMNINISRTAISPYAVVPSIIELAKEINSLSNLPLYDNVVAVNSKKYSFELSKKIKQNDEYFVTTVNELEKYGSNILSKNKLLVKEEYGVSGKGVFLIESKTKLDRLIKYIKKNTNKKPSYLLQPLYDKKFDFSCHLNISSSYTHEILGLRQMRNNGFAFSDISSPSWEIKERLENSSYFDNIEYIIEELKNQGYFGPVCIDSMILENNKIIPLLEINARKSMGLISMKLEEKLSKPKKATHTLFSLSLGFSKKVKFEQFLDTLKKADILYSLDKPYTILPISAGSFEVNKPQQDGQPYKGRLFGIITHHTKIEKDSIMNSLIYLLKELEIKVFS